MVISLLWKICEENFIMFFEIITGSIKIVNASFFKQLV